jgi:radical SAM superfamily enzyme YgiQ (UPF0313 family)
VNPPRGPSILLVYPSSFHYPVWMERVQVKTSQLWLASYLAQNFPVTYADFELTIGRPNSDVQIRRFERRVREYLATHGFDILAISCWTSLSWQATLTVARICREVKPEALIVVGGYHPSARPRDFTTIAPELFDYVITGEGELALEEIACSAARGRPASAEVRTGRPLPADSFVPYDWNLYDDVFRAQAENVDNVYVYFSRGCPFGCSFCMEPLKDRSWRAVLPQEALECITGAVERFQSFAVAVCDACFGMRPAWRKEFFRRFADLDRDIWLVFETRPEYLDDDDLDLLTGRKVEIQFGLESGSTTMLSIMNKTRRPQVYLERFADLSERLSTRGILHRANLIFNHPGETHQTLRETFTYIDSLLDRSDSFLMWACHGYMNFPGCDIDRRLDFYERTYGTRMLTGDWWKTDADQYEASHQVVASRDLGRAGITLWREMLAERDDKLKDCLSPEAFRFAASKYFLEWKNDSRFEKNQTVTNVS